MTELVQHQQPGDLAAQMDYAKAAATSDLLPQAYRGKPANVLIAVGLGQAMGLSPAESLYRIDVIQGKPTASAELIAANVRRAGHLLRVRVDEAAQSATATVIRADDPDYEHTVTRDMAWAKQMGLSGKDNYKKQPVTMLQWRAVSAVARMACPEALYGVVYTPDEIQEHPGAEPVARASAADFTTPQQVASTITPDDPPPAPPEGPTIAQVIAPHLEPDSITSAQQKKMGALMREAGLVERSVALAFVGQTIGREVASRNELSKAEAGQIIDALEADAQAQPTDLGDAPEADEAGFDWPEGGEQA